MSLRRSVADLGTRVRCAQRVFYVALALLSLPSTAPLQAHPQAEASFLIAPQEGALLMGEVERWWARALAWYQRKSPEQTLSLKEKRQQMRPLSRAVGRGCYGCHAKGFKGYNDKGLISAQMMAISAEHDVPCESCHVGARGLTRLGARALLMWRYSVQEGLDCADCHPYQAQFKSLTPMGTAQRLSTEQALLTLAKALELPVELARSQRPLKPPPSPPQ